jgi:mannose-6-phosphate isomerase-like protein (cupin superfamily)
MSYTSPYVGNIENETIKNYNYRKVIFTGKNLQLVVMSLNPQDNIKQEVHKTHDQFIRVEKGNGIIIINKVIHNLSDGIAVIVPAGSIHEVKNTSTVEQLKLYTIYAPPEHPEETLQITNPDKNYKKLYNIYKKKYNLLIDIIKKSNTNKK